MLDFTSPLYLSTDHDIPADFDIVFDAARARIEHFAPDLRYDDGTGFAERLLSHQQRVAEDVHDFMLRININTQAALTLQSALLTHDVGKTHAAYMDDPDIWNRPSKEQAHADKPEKNLHTVRGVEVIDDLITQHAPHLMNHPHSALMRAAALYHHERINGEGYPKGLNDLPDWLQIAGIADTFDGDGIPRPGVKKRSPEEILFRMSGEDEDAPKFIEAFDHDLLEAYTSYKLEQS